MSQKISFSDEPKKHREEKNVQIKEEAKAFNFKSIPGRWTARKDTGLRSKSGFSYVTPAYTAYMRLRGVAVQRLTACRPFERRKNLKLVEYVYKNH